MKALLCLEDGKVFTGRSIGMVGEAVGEVVFNTSMTGYQEIVTDPSYAEQIIVLTYPLIGNYGVNKKDAESNQVRAKGLVIKELCEHPSNYRAEETLHSYLVKHGIVGIRDVDTRAITKHLRGSGTMLGIISTGTDIEKIKAKAQNLKPVTGPHLVKEVTCKDSYTLPGGEYPVVVIDYGAKGNIINSLQALNCKVTVVPATMSIAEILAKNPSGVVLSNGPGDPQDVEYALPVINALLDADIPVMGICLGHQLMGMAQGGKTYKLKFGHRGGNHPVKDYLNNRVYITSQNHGYALSKESLVDKNVEITHLNLHDQTVEGLRHKEKRAFSVQFHPEACPGPQDTSYLFDLFLEMVKEYQEQRGGKNAQG